VVNTASASSTGTAASCTGTLTFLRANGTAAGTAVNFTVTTGQIATATLPYATLATSGRAVVRGVVTLNVNSSTHAAPCRLTSSFETFDTATGERTFTGAATGRTDRTRDTKPQTGAGPQPAVPGSSAYSHRRMSLKPGAKRSGAESPFR
jgi:hypothetical protein